MVSVKPVLLIFKITSRWESNQTLKQSEVQVSATYNSIHIFAYEPKTILLTTNCLLFFFLVLRWFQQFLYQNQHNAIVNPAEFVCDWDV